MGRLLLQREDGKVQPTGDGEDRGPHQRHVHGVLPPQLLQPGQRVCQHCPAHQGGGVRGAAPTPPRRGAGRGAATADPPGHRGPQGGQDLQLPGGVREHQPVQEAQALPVRPVPDVLHGAHPVARGLALCQALQGHLHLHLLLQHRLQAGSEGVSGL